MSSCSVYPLSRAALICVRMDLTPSPTLTGCSSFAFSGSASSLRPSASHCPRVKLPITGMTSSDTRPSLHLAQVFTYRQHPLRAVVGADGIGRNTKECGGTRNIFWRLSQFPSMHMAFHALTAHAHERQQHWSSYAHRFTLKENPNAFDFVGQQTRNSPTLPRHRYGASIHHHSACTGIHDHATTARTSVSPALYPMMRRVRFPLVAHCQVISTMPHLMYPEINQPCTRDLLRCTTALNERHTATTSKRISIAHSLYILYTDVTHSAENNMKIEGWQALANAGFGRRRNDVMDAFR